MVPGPFELEPLIEGIKWFILYMLALVFCVWVGKIFVSHRSRQILERWANNNDYQILSFEVQPWWLSRRFYHRVYYVVVQTPEGQTKRGWVRCGSLLWGILVDKTDASWDE
jgi:hypothetical protein